MGKVCCYSLVLFQFKAQVRKAFSEKNPGNAIPGVLDWHFSVNANVLQSTLTSHSCNKRGDFSGWHV